jgi:hypothetical protein
MIIAFLVKTIFRSRCTVYHLSYPCLPVPVYGIFLAVQAAESCFCYFALKIPTVLACISGQVAKELYFIRYLSLPILQFRATLCCSTRGVGY